jgi:hypothetical protein
VQKIRGCLFGQTSFVFVWSKEVDGVRLVKREDVRLVKREDVRLIQNKKCMG